MGGLRKDHPPIIGPLIKSKLFMLHLFVHGAPLRAKSRAYFSVQYCTLCAILMEKCAVLNAKMGSIQI